MVRKAAKEYIAMRIAGESIACGKTEKMSAT
jgi:hypothetical protein